MKWLAYVLMFIISLVFTAIFVVVADAIGYTLNPYITFIAVFLFITWLAMA